MIRIVAGAGGGYGSGHLARMEILKRLLSEKGIPCRLDACSSETEIRRLTVEKSAVVVLDARDFPASLFSVPVIALDNRNRGRAGDHATLYHDTLPHPDAGDVLENCLIDPALGRISISAPAELPVLIYAGRQNLPACIDEFALESGAFVVREAQLGRGEFLDRLAAAGTVLSYFGMTILEAMFLQRRVVQFSIASSVHDSLSMHLERTCGVPFVRDAHTLRAALPAQPSVCRPGAEGYHRLLNLIERTAEGM